METFIKIMGVLMVSLLLAILFAFPTMWLWNYLMPVIFGLTKITFFQTLGLTVLSGFLFGKININK